MKETTNPGEAARVISFIEKFLTLQGSYKGDRFRLLPWQREVIEDIYAPDEDGKRKRRRYLLGIPRKNGKSVLAAALACYHLFGDRTEAEPLVISAAGDRAQARMVFDAAREMVLASPALKRNARVFKNYIQNTRNGGIYKVVSADAGLAHGLNPSVVIVDEVHVHKTDDLIVALTSGSAMRKAPLFVFISTAGYDPDSPLGKLYAYGRKVESGEAIDPAFGFKWYGPMPGEVFDPGDPKAWKRFNPLFDVMSLDDFEAAFRSMPQNEFLRLRCNAWTETSESFLPYGAWEALVDKSDPLKPSEEVVLGFDGAWSLDSTALVACRLRDMRLFVLGHWEAPDGDRDWRVPTDDVKKTIEEAFRAYTVKELAADPWRFEETLSGLMDLGYPVVDFPTNVVARMVPATQSFYQAVMDGTVSHDGNPMLARHMQNAVLREDARGARITKARKNSKRHIDLAVAAIVAHHRAMHWNEPAPAREAQLLILGD